jgi:Spondin_N
MLESMKKILAIALFIGFVSCTKEAVNVPIEIAAPFEASYKIIFRLKWQNPEFAVPAGAHVTALTGMIHSKDTSLWNTGSLATRGLEDVAEEGNSMNMNMELDAIIAEKKALSKFLLPAPLVTGGLDTVLNFNTSYSCISFTSMIAPSPDWFMGLHNVDLFHGNSWVKDTTVSLMLYDAGTEDGDTFGYDNPETAPRQKISLLTSANAMVLANGNSAIYAIGTVRFIKN